MRRVDAEELRRTTLARQFPQIEARDGRAVLDLFERLGPIQSQVPRAPFLTASSRLPGVGYAVVRDLFAGHELLKTTSLRGTVHTTTRADFVRTDAVARHSREPVLRRELRLGELPAGAVAAELERFCGDEWRPRTEVVSHLTEWLDGRGIGFEPSTFSANLIWGHSGLIRRPKDEHWEKRTDTFHRTARDVVALPPRPDPSVALAELVRVHLSAYGPLTRADLAFFFGVRLGEVDAALAVLAAEVEPLMGPDGEPMLDLAEAAGRADAEADPGVRLLPEYDGLLVGYAGPNRTRFCGPEHLARVWAKANGVFSPVVLAGGRIVASWRTVSAGRRTRLELELLPGASPPAEDDLAPQVAALCSVLALCVDDVSIRR